MRFFCSLLLLLFCILGFSQGTNSELTKQFKTITAIDSGYVYKIKTIEKLIKIHAPLTDSISLASVYNEYGKFNYKNKDFKGAIANTRKALEIQKYFIDSIPSIVNKSYNNIALFQLFSGDEKEALKTFKTLISQNHKDKYVLSAYTKRLSDLYLNRGDYFRVINYLKEAENDFLNTSDALIKKELYQIYLAFSRVYSKTGKEKHYAKALEYLKKTEASISHLSPNKQLKIKIIIFARYGYIYDELKAYKKGISFYSKALEISLKTKPINKQNLATIYDALGFLNSKLGTLKTAKENYDNALKYAPFKTSVYDNLGDYYLTKKHYKKALSNYQKAINYTISEQNEMSYTHLPTLNVVLQSQNKVNLVNDLKDKANAWLEFYYHSKNKNYLNAALETVTLADLLVDDIRTLSFEQQSKYFWRNKGVDLYLLASSICFELEDANRAFYFMEKSKSLSLLEDLTNEEAKTNARLPEKLREKEYELRHAINKTRTNSNRLNEGENQSLLFNQKKEYETFINSLEKKYQGYVNYKKNIKVLSLEESRKELTRTNSSLVQYILTEYKGFGMYIGKTQTHFFKIDDVKTLNNEVRAIISLIKKPHVTPKLRQQYIQLSNAIYKKIFPFLTTPFSNEKLIVIPDYTLQYMPFESLIVNKKKLSKKEMYLINGAEISYTYSMSLLNKIEQKVRHPKDNFIGFAPIEFKNNTLSSLRRSASKIKEAQNLFSGDIALNEKATKANFKKQANDYKIIHLATHANALNTEEPWIAFRNEKLTLNELYFTKNQADLVVLDACKTGLGDLILGEGIMSLSRGFFHSGSKSVVSSLWSTNEKSSSEILLNFYSYLKNGETKSSALRKAKLDYLEKAQLSENSPYFWSALVLNGSSEMLSIKQDSTHYYYFLVLILTIIIIGFVIKKCLS